MKFKTCKFINDHFLLDDKFLPFLKKEKGKSIYVTDGLEKGYIYASLFFYDEVNKEVVKLEKVVRKTQEEVRMESPNIDPSIVMVEISRRVKDIIGDNSLDYLIKRILAEETKHISLVPDEQEAEKFEVIHESVFAELLSNFYSLTIRQAVEEGSYRTITLSQKYIDGMTARQKKLFSPALRMVGFLNNIRLEEYSADESFKIRFRPEKLNKPFDAQEETIKNSLKKLLADNI